MRLHTNYKVIFPHGVLGQVWFLIASISDLRLLPSFPCFVIQHCVSFLVFKSFVSVYGFHARIQKNFSEGVQLW